VLTEPLGYLDFMKLLAHAQMVLTDSVGIQEETNVGLDPDRILAAARGAGQGTVAEPDAGSVGRTGGLADRGHPDSRLARQRYGATKRRRE
jgi:hypothetical protein